MRKTILELQGMQSPNSVCVCVCVLVCVLVCVRVCVLLGKEGGQETRELEIIIYRNVCLFYDRRVQRKNDYMGLRQSREAFWRRMNRI